MTWCHDWQVAPLWLGATATLIASAWRVSSRLFPLDPWGQRVGHAIVIGWAITISCALALGGAGLLDPVLLLALVPAVSLAVTAWVVRSSPASRSESVPPPNPGGGQCDTTGGISRWLPAAIWVAAAALLIGHLATTGLARFPDDWDTVMYHLPLVVHWLQRGSLWAPDCPQWSVPGNNELFLLWVVGPFSGDFLYSLANLPVIVLFAWAVHELGRLLGISRALRNLCSLAAVSTYVVIKQSTTAGNDVAAAAFFLGGLVYLFRYSQGSRTADLALAAACLGLLTGIKYYALGYAAVLAAAGVGLAARRAGWSGACRVGLAVALGAAVFGGYWYARNWVVGGTPLYPVGRATAADEYAGDYSYPQMLRTTFLGNGSPGLLPLAVEAVYSMTGPWHLLAVIGLPALVLWIAVGGLGRPGRREADAGADLRVTLAGVTVGSLLVLLVTPFAVESAPGTLNELRKQICPTRYGTCFLSLALVCLTLVLNDVSRWLREGAASPGAGLPRLTPDGRVGTGFNESAVRRAAAVLLPAIYAAGVGLQIKPHTDRLAVYCLDSILIGLNVVIVGFALAVFVRRRSLLGPALATVTLVAVALGAGTDWLSRRWHREFAKVYDRRGGGLFEYIQRHPPSTTICVLDLSVYPFFGSARQFRVCQPTVMGSSAEWWRRYLSSRNARLVVVPHQPGEDWLGCPHAPAWCAREPGAFRRVEGNTWPLAVYQVEQDQSHGGRARWQPAAAVRVGHGVGAGVAFPVPGLALRSFHSGESASWMGGRSGRRRHTRTGLPSPLGDPLEPPLTVEFRQLDPRPRRGRPRGVLGQGRAPCAPGRPGRLGRRVAWTARTTSSGTRPTD